LKKLLANAFSRFCHFLFIELVARRAARHFRFFVPTLGMVENEKLVVASRTKAGGLVYVSGFTTPRLEWEVFVPSDEGWKPRKVAAVITKDGALQELDETGAPAQTLSFRDPAVEPAIALLRASYPVFPFTHYNISTQEQLDARRPPLKG
jgi:hypothetical protein